jgi:ATP-dependent exoDNAse (exonuclease V) beta subunit
VALLLLPVGREPAPVAAAEGTEDVAPAIVKAGLAGYEAWRTQRDRASTLGARSTIQVRTVTQWASAKDDEGASPKLPGVDIIELPRAPQRPFGPRFGTLVHAVLATVPLDAERDVIERLTATHGRTLGASDQELESATEIVRTVLAHSLLVRAREARKTGRCRREVPMTWRESEAALAEGVIDLAFEENGSWTVVDFKTDEEFVRGSGAYRRQVSLYAAAVQSATGKPASPILMRV